MGFLDSVNPIAVWQRMGWSLGNVPQRYIKSSGSSADEYVGRLLAGFDNASPNFSSLPPHFQNGILTNNILEICVPCYLGYPESFRACVPLLLASVVHHHHHQWLIG